MSAATCPMCARGLRLSLRHVHQVLGDPTRVTSPDRPCLLVKASRTAAQGATVVVGAGEMVREVLAVAGRDMPDVVNQLVALASLYRAPILFVCEAGVGARLRDQLMLKERVGVLGPCNVIGVKPKVNGMPRLSIDRLVEKMWARAREEEPRGRTRAGDSW